MYWNLYSISLLLLSYSGTLSFGRGEDEGVCVDKSCPDYYSKIYQDIWDADQSMNGITAITSSMFSSSSTNSSTTTFSDKHGYVVVQEPENWDGNKDLHVISKLVLPQAKQSTYNLVKALFDNYTLNQKKPEHAHTTEQKKEVKDFIDGIKATAPMVLARKFIDAENNNNGSNAMTDDEWYNKIYKLWFEIYNFSNKIPQRSGFEHVFVGEQNGESVNGYHFWYKYYLDDNAVKGYANEKDNMDFLGIEYKLHKSEGIATPEFISLKYVWDALDYESNTTVTLTKKIGSFNVGCSPEGLIALGMVAFYDPRGGKQTVINGAKYEMTLFKGGVDNGNINTFFPKFLGLADEAPDADENPVLVDLVDEAPIADENDDDIRIIAALVNPDGNDMDKETVTLINASNRSVDLEGWSIAGNNGNAYKLNSTELDAGEVKTFKLPGEDVQLVNKSAKITLKSATGKLVDAVSYNRRNIKSGFTTVF